MPGFRFLYVAQNNLAGQMREAGHGYSWEAVGLLQKIGSTGITCAWQTQGMLKRIGYSNNKFVLMSQSHRTIPVAQSPMCTAHTFWALMMCLPYILVTWSDFTLCTSHTRSHVQVMCFLLHWFMTVLKSIFRLELEEFIIGVSGRERNRWSLT